MVDITTARTDTVCEVVAAFRKARYLRAAAAELIEFGIHRYDINATAPLTSETHDAMDSYYALWVLVENIKSVDFVTEILERHGGENIHIDEDDNVWPKKSTAYNLQTALNDPQQTFLTPKALMASHFAPEVKKDMLQRWAYELRLQDAADDEGMQSKDRPNILGDIETAISVLSKKV